MSLKSDDFAKQLHYNLYLLGHKKNNYFFNLLGLNISMSPTIHKNGELQIESKHFHSEQGIT